MKVSSTNYSHCSKNPGNLDTTLKPSILYKGWTRLNWTGMVDTGLQRLTITNNSNMALCTRLELVYSAYGLGQLSYYRLYSS